MTFSQLLHLSLPIDRISPFIFFIYLIYNILFISYFIHTYRKKALFTLDLYLFAQPLWLPIGFMLPFIFSDLNGLPTAGHWDRIRTELDHAFLLAVLGTAFAAGGFLLGKRLPLPLPGLTTTFRSLRRAWFTSGGVMAGTFLNVIFVVLFASLGFIAFNARATALENRQILPIFNFFYIFTGFITICTVTYYLTTRRKLALFCLVGLAFCGLFAGTRGPFLFQGMQAVVIYAIATRYKGLLFPVLIVPLLLVLAIYVGGFRYGNFGAPALADIPLRLLYGNNFSDLRDFAWMISHWDGVLLWGKTLIAGFLTGLPGVGEFRSMYAWGNWSVYTALGFTSRVHPGLRGIAFSEWYFNFGLIGLCASGMFYGFLVARLSAFSEQAIATGNRQVAVLGTLAAFIYWMMVSNFIATASFFTLHILGATILVGLVVSVAIRKETAGRMNGGVTALRASG